MCWIFKKFMENACYEITVHEFQVHLKIQWPSMWNVDF